jgi:MFS family permease
MLFGLPRRAIAANTGALAVGVSAWVLFRGVAASTNLYPPNALWLTAFPALLAVALQLSVALIADRFGTKATVSGLLAVISAGLLCASIAPVPTAALLCGLGSAIFAVGLHAVSASVPASRQGLALGLFACGLAGTSVAAFTFPFLTEIIGLYGVLAEWAIVAAAAAGLYAKVHPPTPPRMQLRATTILKPLQESAAWRIGLYLAATLGLLLTAAPITIFSAGLSPIVGVVLARRFGARPVLGASLGASLFFQLVATLLRSLPNFALPSEVAAGIAIGTGIAAALSLLTARYPRPSVALTAMLGSIAMFPAFALGPFAGAPLALAAGAALAFEPAQAPAPAEGESMSASLLRLAEQTGTGVSPAPQPLESELRVKTLR